MKISTAYERLEDDLIRINGAIRNVGRWAWFRRRPGGELREHLNVLHASIELMREYIVDGLMAAQYTDEDNTHLARCRGLLNKAELVLVRVLRRFPSLNRWGYLLRKQR